MRTSASASLGPRSLTCARAPSANVTNRDGGPPYLASRIARGISGWLKYQKAPSRRTRKPPPMRNFLMALNNIGPVPASSSGPLARSKYARAKIGELTRRYLASVEVHAANLDLREGSLDVASLIYPESATAPPSLAASQSQLTYGRLSGEVNQANFGFSQSEHMRFTRHGEWSQRHVAWMEDAWR